jgi:hypothetical protein
LWLASFKKLGLLKALAEAAGTTTASIRNAALWLASFKKLELLTKLAEAAGATPVSIKNAAGRTKV